MQDPEPLPSGRYRGVARDPHYVHPRTGKKGRRYSKTFNTFTEAAAWAEAEERRIGAAYRDHGIEVTRQQRGCPLLADFAIEWAGTVDGELSTQAGAMSHAREIARHWPTQRVDAITRPMVREYLKAMADAGLKPGTREQRLSHLRKLMAAAVEAGDRESDPTIGVRGPRVPERQGRHLTDAELMVVLVCLPGWLWPAALLSHDAGLRIQEIAGLRMHNLDLLHGTVTIAEVVDVDGSLRSYPKGKEIRDVPPVCPLPSRPAQSRPRSPAGRQVGPRLRRPRHRQAGAPEPHPRGMGRALGLAMLEGEKPTWHDLRHGCATTLAEAGASPWVIQAILGHRSINTTQRYVRKANLSAQAAAIDNRVRSCRHR